MPTGDGLLQTGFSLRAGTREMSSLLDRMHAGVGTPIGAGEVASLVGDLDRISRRVDALKLRVLAQPAAGAAAEQAGFRDTSTWLARQTRTTGDDAHRQVRLADQLATATRTGEALAAGDISDKHAQVVTGALGQLPERLTAAERDKVEADLVRKAETMDPAGLRKAARRALEAVEPDPVVVDAHENSLLESEEDRARARAKVTIHDNGDGTTTLYALMPTLTGDILAKIINTLIASRRNPITGQAEQVPAGTDWGHRRGLAFMSLIERLPTDHLHPKTAATLVVQISHDVLIGALAAAGVETDHPISAATARRLACEAAIIPTVLAGTSLPLDLGRQKRLHTQNQRVGLSTRHTHCAANGCTIPFAWCEIHHRNPWSRGGSTDLANAVPLCSFHHHQTHRDNRPQPPLVEPEERQRRGRRDHPHQPTTPIPTQRRAPART